MKSLLFTCMSCLLAWSTQAQVIDWEHYPVYTGSDLGLTYTQAASKFRIYAPTAEQAELILFKEGIGGEPIARIDMEKSDEGTWAIQINGDQAGKFYAFRVRINNAWSQEVPDPYVKCVGVNGKRGMIINLDETNPPDWEANEESPPFAHATDAIIYELHVRDASMHASSGIQAKGKFMGLTETGTHNPNGKSTGLDHLKELGVTHIHLLPSYDFNSIDESVANNPHYNWGYDPLNYNVPEGSYATNAYDGATRIREFKQLIKTLHDNGLRVVLDVVYNHTGLTQHSSFNELVPGYYYRQNPDGTFSNGTACGNETASERPMMRKFMLESVLFWVNEYHLDGFRFDLMGVHDIETMNLLADELRKIKPDILLYGEGWSAGQVQLKEEQQAVKKNASKLHQVAVFSDDIRDGIKGSVFNHQERGFASGLTDQDQSVRFGVVAACQHPQVDYARVKYAHEPYAAAPDNTVTYCECHDNHTLWDKLALSASTATEAQRKEMHKLALSIVLTSQGISFLHAGTEFLRSKQGVENSFESPDAINAIDWNLKTRHDDVFRYVKALIAIRKTHPAFRLRTAQQIQDNISFLPSATGMVAYTLKGAAVNDSWSTILVAYNGASQTQTLTLPSGKWSFAVRNNVATHGHAQRTVELQPYSCIILHQ